MILLNDDMKNILDEFSKYEQTEAIVIAGSRASGNNDEMSDYDIYIYSLDDNFIPENIRNNVYNKFCSKSEIGNSYFETEDNIILNCGIYADIIFRNMHSFRELSQYIQNGGAMLGYTTAFWHNLKNSTIYFDRCGKFAEFQKMYDIPYPQQLRKNIIIKNMNMLSGVLPSYDKQIEKAVKRNDIVSICHRTSAYMESYFDIIFALNEMTHPGEKRLIKICKEQCKLLPKDFEENINRVYKNMYGEYDFEALKNMYINLRELVEKNIEL